MIDPIILLLHNNNYYYDIIYLRQNINFKIKKCNTIYEIIYSRGGYTWKKDMWASSD